jgi:5,10-methylene-tetrahydrofolate dehydrogenase/methenyl tetrahydrofolate cyclohydrolase
LRLEVFSFSELLKMPNPDFWTKPLWNNLLKKAFQKSVCFTFFLAEMVTPINVLTGISLAGKRCLVTGGSQGLGKQITKQFLDAGAKVSSLLKLFCC